MDGLVLRQLLIERIGNMDRAVLGTGATTRADVLVDVPRLADEGDGAFGRKDYGEALRLYDAAVRLVPGNDELIFWRGSMKMTTGDGEGAVEDVAEAIRLNERWRPLIARIPETVFPGVEALCGRLAIERAR